MEGADGALYGTTFAGGSENLGTVFRVTKTGEFTSLYSFTERGAAIFGTHPASSLAMGPDGSLYGATSKKEGSGFGAIFRITPDGKVLPFQSFSPHRPVFEYRHCLGALAVAMDHSIVAVLQGGEPTLGQPDPRGAVLRIVGGTWQVLRYFEGESPSGQPWIEPDGAIVGTTRQPSGGGSVFRLESLK